tara:strand:+ start:11056 stop:11964 length:909 start_codon:yes stop_codon:yes gene_type:complete
MATVLETVQVGLRRAGLEETNTAYKDYGRTYLNAIIKEIEGDATWWWKFKTGTITTTKTMTLTGIADLEEFTAGETITGSSSSATATVVAHTAGESTLTFKSESGTFTTSETVTGGSSGSAGSYVSDTTTRLYAGANNVQSLISAFNETGNDTLSIERPRIIQRQDPDFTETGTPCYLYPWGIDSSGVIQMALYPMDSTTNETITYQYYSYTPDFTSDNDTDSLDGYVHPIVQPALYFGIARLLKQQEGDDEGGLIEEAEFQKALSRARRNNIDVLGDIVTRQMLPPMTDTGWAYGVPEGSL